MFMQYLESCLHRDLSDLVNFEAAKSLCELHPRMRNDLDGALSVL
jgi:coatomer protein complex subunit gamma